METFACFFRAIILKCPEDIKMFHSTSGQRDRQKDKYRGRQLGRKIERQNKRKTAHM